MTLFREEISQITLDIRMSVRPICPPPPLEKGVPLNLFFGRALFDHKSPGLIHDHNCMNLYLNVCDRTNGFLFK